MKKLLAILSLVIGCVFDSQADEINKYCRSGIFGEIGAGVATGNHRIIETDFSASIGLGYRYHFGKGIHWDIVKVSYYNPGVSKRFEDSSTVRFLSSIRYLFNPFNTAKPLYASFGAGYQINVADSDHWKGFAYEFNVGFVIAPSCSLGLMWEGNVSRQPYLWDGPIHGVSNSYTTNFGTFGIRLGFLFQ